MNVAPEADLNDMTYDTQGISVATMLGDVDLRDALSSARIHVMYQPIVRMQDRAPVGLEALARLHHPAHGVMRPDLFVPPMEDAGLACQLTEAVLGRAFADWKSSGLGNLDLTLAINVPLDVFLLPDALSRIDRARAAAGLPASGVVIELTETSPLIRLPELATATRHLRDLGYGLAIDDVGPLVRDHSELLKMPFTMLKLDKDLVRESATDHAAADFLAGALADAGQDGLLVIAEGIETEADWMRMRALGVHMAQGFHVGRPMKADMVAAWHRKWSACDAHS